MSCAHVDVRYHARVHPPCLRTRHKSTRRRGPLSLELNQKSSAAYWAARLPPSPAYSLSVFGCVALYLVRAHLDFLTSAPMTRSKSASLFSRDSFSRCRRAYSVLSPSACFLSASAPRSAASRAASASASRFCSAAWSAASPPCAPLASALGELAGLAALADCLASSASADMALYPAAAPSACFLSASVVASSLFTCLSSV